MDNFVIAFSGSFYEFFSIESIFFFSESCFFFFELAKGLVLE